MVGDSEKDRPSSSEVTSSSFERVLTLKKPDVTHYRQLVNGVGGRESLVKFQGGSDMLLE
jgi:hypothetical protein